MLTGKQLIEQGVIFGEIAEENIAQHGIDLNLIKVEQISEHGFIPRLGKTVQGERKEITLIDNRWMLNPGVYDITFAQGCNVPRDKRLEVIQRSSISRNGGFIRSAVFDAGFNTERIGTIIVFHLPITIEYYARVAQVVSYESNIVENLYEGQWQNDKQRKV